LGNPVYQAVLFLFFIINEDLKQHGASLICSRYIPYLLSGIPKELGLAVASQWLWTFAMILITPVGIRNIGWRMYLIFAIFNECFVPFTYFFVPETAGISPEAVDFYFMDHDINPVWGDKCDVEGNKRG
jgi:hypothetical protein